MTLSWRFTALGDRHRALGSNLEDWSGMGTAWTYDADPFDQHVAIRTRASLLAAVLPNPRAWSASRPGPRIQRRANWIRQQSYQLGGSHYISQLSRQAPDWWPQWLPLP